MQSNSVQDFLAGPLEALGYEIIKVNVAGLEDRKIVEIMIDRLDGEKVTIQDCKIASREASAHLDVEDIIKSAYILDVTSPGIDRPLIKESDFTKNLNKFVKITVSSPVEGRKRFKGRLLDFKENKVLIEATLENEEIQKFEISFDNIHKANLAPRFDGIKISYS